MSNFLPEKTHPPWVTSESALSQKEIKRLKNYAGSIKRSKTAIKRNKKAISQVVNLPHGESYEWSQVCEFSKLSHVPDNVKPDWLAAVRETIELILATPIPTEKRMGRSVKELAKNHKSNLTFVKKVKKELDERFGKAKQEMRCL